MNAYAFLAVHDTAAIAGGVYLVTHDHPWWAALCFLMALTTTVKTTTTKQEQSA